MGGYKRTFKGCVLNVIRSDKETKRLVKIQKKRDNDDHFFFSLFLVLPEDQRHASSSASKPGASESQRQYFSDAEPTLGAHGRRRSCVTKSLSDVQGRSKT